MVLESFQKVFTLKNKTSQLFLVGFLHTTLAIFLSLWVFSSYASLVMVFLVVISCIPFMYRALKEEEFKDETLLKERILLKGHGRVLYYFMVLFVGITIAFSFWYVVLPVQSSELVFKAQTITIESINTQISGHATSQLVRFKNILLNNLKVLIFCILFSFAYGTGALFILTWNASILGTAIGNFIRTNLSAYAGTFGLNKVSNYFHIIALGLLKYAPHGIPEILAYFTAGLAGGIISIAVIKLDLKTEKFHKTVLDSFDLVMLSIALIVIAALIEAYITPVLF